jgi:NADPH2:quinone reductase
LLLVGPLQFVYDGVGKSTFDASLKCLDYLGWLISFGNASGKPEPFDVLRCATAAAAV